MSEIPDDAGREQPPIQDMVQARRTSAPRYPVFIVVGALVGFVAAMAATFLAAPNEEYGRGSVLGYTALVLGLVGGLLGGAVAVLLDRRR